MSRLPGPPPWLAAFLAAFGIKPRPTWLGVLHALLFRSQPERSWRLAGLFPHVRFNRLVFADLLRIPLQLLWLALVIPRPRPGEARAQAPPLLPRLRRGAAALTPACLNSALRWVRAALTPDLTQLRALSYRFASHELWDHRLVRAFTFIVSAILALLCITTPFSAMAQTIFLLALWAIAMVIRRVQGKVTTLILVVLSVTASTRYLWWRIWYTVGWDSSTDAILGLLLLTAEIYTYTILLLGYVQTAWPLHRQPVRLPADSREWPPVDIFIPTYNEPLKVVKPTVYAALGLDWPQEKIAIYLLDDGRREEFREFAATMGINYIARPDNRHAKAGNLNHALTKSSGEFIAIFDCDHIPTRAFLQIVMGGFVKTAKLALIQTPHHFFSPDPFERNLNSFRRVPNEGELFHGLIQDGNDLWDATYFCGSCAVIRRAPLEEIGGIAVETVTEDAHTAIKLHRLGYTSAYLNLPLAAGLATESLSAHIGQRIRWARGMIQILRLDNPLRGPGLHWAQRLCYSNAMFHFLNGIPRLIYLTGPLAFLLCHGYVIYAPAISVLLYVLPHMVHANMAASRMQGAFRHSLWAEVYETVLAWYISWPATVALVDPHRGKFNVTVKGGQMDQAFFDWHISRPYLVVVSLILLGFLFGLGRIVWGPREEIATVLLNLLWLLFNATIVGGALAVAEETKQVRLSHRVRITLPAILHLAGGKLIHCQTVDYSEGGVALTMAAIPPLHPEETVKVSLWRGSQEHLFPARVISLTPTQLRLRWELVDQAQEMALVQCTFTQADAWLSWKEEQLPDRPLNSIREVLNLGLTGYRRLGRHALPLISPTIRLVSELISWFITLLPRTPITLRR